jgi:hypothetical protein
VTVREETTAAPTGLGARLRSAAGRHPVLTAGTASYLVALTAYGVAIGAAPTRDPIRSDCRLESGER